MDADEEVAVFLEHFGIKGMHWGVRSNKKVDSKTDHRNRNIAVALGSTLAIGAIGIGALYAKNHLKIPISDISKSSNTAKNFAESMAKEPVGIVHSSRGKNLGYTFLQHGGMSNPGEEFIKAGFGNGGETFKRYGSRSEKVAARFLDPLGRKDFSGRLIGHDVIIPEFMAHDVHNIEDAKNKTWPLIKDIYQAYWEKSQKERF